MSGARITLVIRGSGWHPRLVRPQADGGHRSLGRVEVLDFDRETGWDLTAARGDTFERVSNGMAEHG